jgi:hypothetical protein
MASKRLGPLPRSRWAALGRGCGREGSGALPLPRAAAISTRVRVQCTTSLLYSSPGKKWSMYLG